jgi:ADP-ribose pyrophosphatase
VPKVWKKLSSTRHSDHRIFRLLREDFESPRNGHVLDAAILEAPDWVNVIALTDDEQCVLVRQYRFGTGQITMEIPGGMIEPGEWPRPAALYVLPAESG